ncbi:MAG: hypothetical protein AB1801_02150, partial [Chloroflexota bacterium]
DSAAGTPIHTMSVAGSQSRAALAGDAATAISTAGLATEVVSPAPAPAIEKPVQPASRWTYTLEPGQGLPLLIGDIGVAREPVTIFKPDGATDRLTSGSKPEYGAGGFETYANKPGTYKVQFLGETFEIALGGQQLTKVIFSRLADPGSVRVDLSLREKRSAYRVGEKVFATIEVANISAQPVPFGILGLLTDRGRFQTSWDNHVIKPGETFRHEDGLAFDAPGVYKLQLSICFARKDACQQSDQGWARFEPRLQVVVE